MAPISSKSNPLEIMLVDDSAVVRGMITRVLSGEPDIKIIKSVVNGQLALEALDSCAPDIILLDVEMPVMDGMTALPKLLKKAPDSKIVMCSTLTVRNASITLEALKLGATDCIGKPTSPQDIQPGGEFQLSLLNILRGLGKKKSKDATARQTPGSYTLSKKLGAYTGKPFLVAIGSSTGGPQALFEVIKHFKGLDVPIILTQHMPATFTKILAQHINTHTGVTAVEAEDSMPIEPGVVYVAPGGYHMLMARHPETKHLIAKLDEGPPVNFCKPAVDPMLKSAIDVFGNKVLGVILTGMGNDGLDACKMLIEKNGRVIAQDEKTSVVWGMPGAVAKAGLCSAVLPVGEVGPWVRKAVTGS